MLATLAEASLASLDGSLALASLDKRALALTPLRATLGSVTSRAGVVGAASPEAKRREIEPLLASLEAIVGSRRAYLATGLRRACLIKGSRVPCVVC